MAKPKIMVELRASDKTCHVEDGSEERCQFATSILEGADSHWFCQFFGVTLKKNGVGDLVRDTRCIEKEKRFLESLPSILELRVEEKKK